MENMKFKFDLQRFADTTIPPELVLKSWAKQVWEAGIHDSYFSRFMPRLWRRPVPKDIGTLGLQGLWPEEYRNC